MTDLDTDLRQVSGEARTSTAEDRLWSVADVSHYLGIPVATLYQWRCARRGPRSRRVGRYIRYLPGDVKAWVVELGASDGA